jgi:predicted Zn-dependent protease
VTGRARAAAAAAVLAAACASPPPPAPLVPAWHQPGATLVVADDERALWDEAARERESFAKDGAFLDDAPLTAYLDAMITGLLPPGLPDAMPRPHVHVLRATELNGAAAPDGGVFVSTSLLAALADEAQLAALFGHELAHLLARHTLIERRYRAHSASTARRMTLSRAQEDEADRLGLALMRDAGYEPRAAVEMLSTIATRDPEERGAFPRLESHPFLDERIRTLRGLVPRAGAEQGRREISRYENAIAPVLLVAAENELEAGRLPQARAAIDRHLRLRPGSGRAHYLRAEHARRVEPSGRHAPAVRQAYERALELSPDDPDALRALGFLVRENGETERARELFARYLRAAPGAPDRKLIERYLGPAGDDAKASSPAAD